MSARNDKPAVLEVSGRSRDSQVRGDVEGFQRARVISAMFEVASDVGYLGAAVAPVVARAGVSRRTFYELFDGREDCFLAAFEWGAAQIREIVVEAYDSQRSWRERVRHALAALLLLLDSEPELARVCVIEALGAGKLVLERRAQLLDELIAAIEEGAPRPRGNAGKPLLSAEGVVGGAFSVIHGRMLEQRQGLTRGDRVSASKSPHNDELAHPLIGLQGQLMALIALPYLGARAAGEELTRTVPEVSHDDVAPAAVGESRRLLERLHMRLTYRTVRCLTFIGEHPGSSNREISRGADVSDEGQASKLLTRLTKLDLIANESPRGPGFPNRWTLTARGQQVLSSVQRR